MPRYDIRELAAIFTGGAVGALGRAALVEWLPPHAGRWPWATFAVNVAGAFLLRYFAPRAPGRPSLSPDRRPPLGTRRCGGLPTLPTIQPELVRIVHPR